jgi:hypothetical protein
MNIRGDHRSSLQELTIEDQYTLPSSRLRYLILHLFRFQSCYTSSGGGSSTSNCVDIRPDLESSKDILVE